MNTSYAPPAQVAERQRTDFRFTPQRPRHYTAPAETLAQEADFAPAPVDATASPACPYSCRQVDVLKLLAEGYSSAQCAKALGISTETVRTHRQHILQRSERRNMVSLIVEAVRLNWI